METKKPSIRPVLIFLFVVLFSFFGLNTAHAQNKAPLPDHTKSQMSSNRNLAWKPDTVTTYNTTGLKEKIIYTYNPSGKLLSVLSVNWENNEWVNSYKHTYIYEENSSIKLELEWQNGEWQNSYQITTTYDNNENKLNEIFKEWQNENWTNYFKITWSYDNNDNMLTETYQMWQTDTWSDYSKLNYVYDDEDYLTSYTFLFFENNEWVNFTKNTYAYNIDGSPLSYFIEHWETSSSEWAPAYKGIHEYDDSGNITTTSEVIWQSNEWVNHERFSYTYDNSNNAIIGMCEKYQDSMWVATLSNLDLYSNQTSIFIIREVYRYKTSYIDFTTNTESYTESSKISIYPNPTKNQLHINFTEYKNNSIEIFNLQGQLCHTQELLSNRTVISTQSLPKGLYTIKVKNKTGFDVFKFIKE